MQRAFEGLFYDHEIHISSFSVEILKYIICLFLLECKKSSVHDEDGSWSTMEINKVRLDLFLFNSLNLKNCPSGTLTIRIHKSNGWCRSNISNRCADLFGSVASAFTAFNSKTLHFD